jgi:hypothetical protein
MTCEKACVAAAVVGAVTAIVAIASLFFKKPKLSVCGSAALLAGGVAAIVVPRSFGFCAHGDMACRYITAPTLAILGGAIVILSIVRLISDLLAFRKPSAAA